VSDQQWIDKLAIQELIYSHCDAITRGDLGALESLYAPDAIWEIPLFGLRTESARAFLDFLADATANADLLVQTAHNSVVRLLDESTAKATTTIFELSRGRAVADGPVGAAGEEVSMVQLAVYYDDVSKSTGRWLFTHRVFVQCYIEHGGWQGEIPNPRSSLLAP
jgi:ketosteroid isomerase-like protein